MVLFGLGFQPGGIEIQVDPSPTPTPTLTLTLTLTPTLILTITLTTTPTLTLTLILTPTPGHLEVDQGVEGGDPRDEKTGCWGHPLRWRSVSLELGEKVRVF